MPQLSSFVVIGKGASAHFGDRRRQQALPGFDQKRRGLGRTAPKPHESAGGCENASAFGFVAGFETIEYLREVGVIAARMDPGRKIFSQFRFPMRLAAFLSAASLFLAPSRI